MKKPSIMIDADPAWKNAFPRMAAKIEKAACAAYSSAKKTPAFKKYAVEINVVLTSDSEMKKLNRFWRGKNKPTNVLSFPQIDIKAPGSRINIPKAWKGVFPLGDVILGLQTVRHEARDQDKTLESHVIHLIIHGVLHLLGYDHMRLKDAKAMEKMECDILEGLGYPHPYHDATDD